MAQYVGLRRAMPFEGLVCQSSVACSLGDITQSREDLCQAPVSHHAVINLSAYINTRLRGGSIVARPLELRQICAAPSLICQEIGTQTTEPFSQRGVQVRLIERKSGVISTYRSIDLGA